MSEKDVKFNMMNKSFTGKKIDKEEVKRQVKCLIAGSVLRNKEYKSESIEKIEKTIINRIEKKWNEGAKKGFEFRDLGWFRAVILGKDTDKEISGDINLRKEFFDEILSFLNEPEKYEQIAGLIIGYFVRNLNGLPKKAVGDLDLSYVDVECISKEDLPENISHLMIANCNNLLSVDLGAIKKVGCFTLKECEKIEEIKNFDNVTQITPIDINVISCPNLEIRELPKSVGDLYVKGNVKLIDGMKMRNVNITRSAEFVDCDGSFENLCLKCGRKLSFKKCNGFIDINRINSGSLLIFEKCGGLFEAKNIHCGGEILFEECKKLEKIQIFDNIEENCSDAPSITIKNCENLKSLLGKTSKTKTIFIENCNKLDTISNNISIKKSEENDESTGLVVKKCNNIKILPSNFFKNSDIIEISNCGICTIPEQLSENENLHTIDIRDCNDLCKIAKLPINLDRIAIVGCKSLACLDLTGNHANRIDLHNNASLTHIDGIEDIDKSKFYGYDNNGNYLHHSTINNENINLLNNEYYGGINQNY